MKTKTVRLIQGYNKYIPYLGAAAIAIAGIAEKTAFLPEPVWQVMACVGMLLLFLLCATVPMSYEIRTISAQAMIVYDDKEVVVQDPLVESLQLFPFVDITLLGSRHENTLTVYLDDDGKLTGRKKIWIGRHISLFKQITNSRSRSFESYALYLRALKNFLSNKFREEFKSEPSAVSLEQL